MRITNKGQVSRLKDSGTFIEMPAGIFDSRTIPNAGEVLGGTTKSNTSRVVGKYRAIDKNLKLVNPSTHMKNFLSGEMNNMAEGVFPAYPIDDYTRDLYGALNADSTLAYGDVANYNRFTPENAGGAEKLADSILNKTDKSLTKMYNAVEEPLRTPVFSQTYDDMMAKGFGEFDAALAGLDEVNRIHFDYSDVPNSVKNLRQIPLLAPFVTFPYKNIPKLTRNMMTGGGWGYRQMYSGLDNLYQGMNTTDFNAMPEYIRQGGYLPLNAEESETGNLGSDVSTLRMIGGDLFPINSLYSPLHADQDAPQALLNEVASGAVDLGRIITNVAEGNKEEDYDGKNPAWLDFLTGRSSLANTVNSSAKRVQKRAANDQDLQLGDEAIKLLFGSMYQPVDLDKQRSSMAYHQSGVLQDILARETADTTGGGGGNVLNNKERDMMTSLYNNLTEDEFNTFFDFNSPEYKSLREYVDNNGLWDEYNAEKADLQLKGLWNDKEGLQALLNQSYTASNNEDLSGMLLDFSDDPVAQYYNGKNHYDLDNRWKTDNTVREVIKQRISELGETEAERRKKNKLWDYIQ